MPCIRLEFFSGVGNKELAPQPFKQLDLIVLFQFRNGLTDRGLCHMQFFGGRSHVARIAHAEKNPQMSESHAPHPEFT